MTPFPSRFLLLLVDRHRSTLSSTSLFLTSLSLSSLPTYHHGCQDRVGTHFAPIGQTGRLGRSALHYRDRVEKGEPYPSLSQLAADNQRTATSSAAKEGTDTKKAKTNSKAAPAPAPKSKSKTDAATEQKKAAEEKKAEAPASAKADTGAKGALKKGDKLPKITLQDNTGADVDVSGLAGEKGVVIFLYPKVGQPAPPTR